MPGLNTAPSNNGTTKPETISDVIARAKRDAAHNRDEVIGNGKKLTSLDASLAGKPAQSSGGGAQAQQHEAEESQEQEKPVEATKRVGNFVMPSLEHMIKASETAQGLEDQEIVEAYKEAEALDFRQALKIRNLGMAELTNASKVSREFLETMRAMNLEEVTELLTGINGKMQELKIGDLEPSAWEKVVGRLFGKTASDKVKQMLDKHKTLSEIIDIGMTAMSEHRQKLEQDYTLLENKIRENAATYTALSKKIAVLEMGYEKSKLEAEELKKEYEKTRKEKTSREISLLDASLTRQVERIDALRKYRSEALTAMRGMDFQLAAVESQIARIDEQAEFSRFVFDNTVLMRASDKRVESSISAVKTYREQSEGMMKDRVRHIADTQAKLIEEHKLGVADIKAFQEQVSELTKLNVAVIKGNLEIRQGMEEAGKILLKLDRLAHDTAAHAAAANEDDVAEAEQVLAAGSEATDVKRDSGAPTSTPPGRRR